MSSLEQTCSVIMLLCGMGAVLLFWAALAIERQRRQLAALQSYSVKTAYRAQAYRWECEALRLRLALVALMLGNEPAGWGVVI
jgi:hypothetical protein